MSKQEAHLSHEVPRPWWMQVCRWVWKIAAGAGTIVLFPIILNGVSTWFTNSEGIIPTDSPLGELLAHWPLVLSIGCCLLLLTVITRIMSQWPLQTTPALSPTQQNRARMLRRLRHMYHDLREQSLQGVAWLDLGLASTPEAVGNAMQLSLRLPNRPQQALPRGTSIRQVYEDAGHELLLLGEPGAGKSTLLLDLAEQLAEQAAADGELPFPVLLPLSSWAIKRPPLHKWLAEQLSTFYNVPLSLSSQWVQTGAILPLLDGLDEMEAGARPACIAAINAYHRMHLGPLVVCSRKTEYKAAASRQRLALHYAVVVQPLSPEQAETYLLQAGKPLSALRSTLKKNRALQDLTTTPLILSILMLTYQGTKIRELSSKQAQLQQQVWEDYIKGMVERKGNADRYSLQRTYAWLGWLARQMREHNQSVFYLEHLQPNWLPKRQVLLYQICVVLSLVLLVVLFDVCAWLLIFGLTLLLMTGPSSELLATLLHALLGTLPIGLQLGLSVGLFIGLRAIRPSEVLDPSRSALRSRLFAGVSIMFSGGTSLLRLSGRAAEIAGKQLTQRLHLSPNEGIRRSAKNGLLTGLPLGLFIGATYALSIGFLINPIFGLLQGLFYALFAGLSLALFFGLGASIQHYILRCWLWRTGLFAGKAVRFLDDATARILLRRVGGGYSFTHRLLLDHFADLYEKAAIPSNTQKEEHTSGHPAV